MNQSEIRYRIASTLLQADSSLTLVLLAEASGVSQQDIQPVLQEMVGERLVVRLKTRPGAPVEYRWAARWEEAAHERDAAAQQELRAAVGAVPKAVPGRLDVESDPCRAFYEYVVHRYRPPMGKRFLVVLQCSVRRPFSTSPSHASMRRAIALATGCDPRKDFERCPVHVVVLASRIGPVPYELEDIYPADVRGGGVKHFAEVYYARVRPVLSQRMAQYVVTHGGSYERVATFTEGRYAEVMQDARAIAVRDRPEFADFPILPRGDGPRVVRVGSSRPRQYWARYWIQLYLEISRHLGPDQRAQAEARLRELQVEYRTR